MWKSKRKKAKTALAAANEQNQVEQVQQVVLNEGFEISALESDEIVVKPLEEQMFAKPGLQWEQNLDLDQQMIYYLKKLINFNSDYPVRNWDQRVYDHSLIQMIAKALGNRDEQGQFQPEDQNLFEQAKVDVEWLLSWIKRYQGQMESHFVKIAPANSNLTYKRQNKYFEQALVSPAKLKEEIQIANGLKPVQNKEN